MTVICKGNNKPDLFTLMTFTYCYEVMMSKFLFQGQEIDLFNCVAG